jgi:hypothetical protein
MNEKWQRKWRAAADDMRSGRPSIVTCVEVKEQIYQHIPNTRITNAD